MKLPSLILDTDSYKTSHWLQTPEGTDFKTAYLEARKQPPGRTFDGHVFFGLQYYLKKYLSTPITYADIYEAEQMFKLHGVPFNREAWVEIVEVCGGKLPLVISAVPEGTIVPIGVPCIQVTNTIEGFEWLTTYIETRLLSTVWYGSTVASLSKSIKNRIENYLELTTGKKDGSLFSLHDFGSRGVSSQESAMIGGMAHLLNFAGTDTVAALWAAREYYTCECAGYSIPAAEHSTITVWGRDGEKEAFRNMLQKFGNDYKIVAVVSDSYDLYNAIENLWSKELKDDVLDFAAKGGKLVIRPDSGIPEDVVPNVFSMLAEGFGTATNSKGFHELPPFLGIIQGDGIDEKRIEKILSRLVDCKMATNSVAFGMGGALLQSVNRDDFSFAYKASEAIIGNSKVDVFKQPVGDPTKASKKGKQAVYWDGKSFVSCRIEHLPKNKLDFLQPVWANGYLYDDLSFEMVRNNVSKDRISTF